MIKDGFLYLAALIFAAAVLVNLPKIFKGKKAQVFFNFAPPIVLIYLGLMLLCTMKVWDLSATSAVYKSVKNPILYAMLFIMLLRCDLKSLDLKCLSVSLQQHCQSDLDSSFHMRYSISS